MTKSFLKLMVLSIPVICGELYAKDYARQDLDHFERTIRPVLIQHCIECHGPQRKEGDLRLDSREAILEGGTRGPSIDPSNRNDSLLLKALRQQGGLEMPPTQKLPDVVVSNFARWIRNDAAWPKTFALPSNLDPSQHWAFKPISSPEVPEDAHPNGVGTSVDPFIIRKLAEQDLSPTKRSDRTTLARRVYQDIVGLPPTASQLNQFVNDATPSAYETMVDKAIANSQFGVHWARMWMDVARYADNKGYIFYLNREFKWAFTYRDYLIESFNEDRSFQTMIIEQIAADQITADDKRPLRAMGFITLGDYFVNNKYDMIDDRIDVITRGFMGLTVTCARCHDHKFDPISTAEYYGLYGVLDSSHDPIVPPLYEVAPQSDEYLAFAHQLKEKKKKLEDFVNSTVQNLKTDGRTRIAEYLMAAYEERNKPDSDNFMLLTDKGGLNPRMIRRWKNHLKDEQAKENSTWSVWNTFAAVPDDQLDEKIAVIYQKMIDGEQQINPIVLRYVLDAQPTTMLQVAQRYEKALLYVKTLTPQPGENWKDPNAEELASSLYAANAPAEIPVNIGFDFLDLFPDRATQADFKKVLEDVENYIRNDPAAPSRALVLLDNESPTEPYVFNRGNPNDRGDYVPRTFLSILEPDPQPFRNGSGRLELARKIASPGNPLTARVMTNRIWKQLMGSGIVETPSDFGLRGGSPSHPQLLDHLSTHFIKSDWSIKSLIKLIVMSQTYQQSSDTPGPPPVADPRNRLLWKANRKRLTWEQTRDAIIHATGELDTTTSGPSFSLNEVWIPRRSAFSYINRLDIPTLLRTFDYPSPNASIGSRSQTTVPQQALWFFNNPFLSEASARIERRPEFGMAIDDQLKITNLYLLLFSREPNASESSAIRNFLSDPETNFQDLIHVLLMSNNFIFVN